jgi:hypothetical protein
LKLGAISTKITNKNTFKILWISLPKYLRWKIWLDRNKVVFNKYLENPIVVVAKEKGLLVEHNNTRLKDNIDV